MPVARLSWILLLVLVMAGCTSTPDFRAIEPDLSALAPAQEALAKAKAAHVEQFAPRALDAARHRVSLARDIIYLAARQGRELNAEEQARVANLVHASVLDSRTALIKTQALATGLKLKQLRRGAAAPMAQPPRTIGQGASS